MFGFAEKIPDDYIFLPLNKILIEPVQGNRFKEITNRDLLYSSISAENFDWDGKFKFDLIKKINLSKDTLKKAEKFKIKDRDILLVKDGATVGKSALVNIAEYPLLKNSYVNEHTYILRLNSKLINEEYLFNYLNFNAVKFIIRKISKASAQEGLGKEFLHLIYLPIPKDIKKQKEIIKNLENDNEKINLMLNEINKQKDNLSKIALSIFQEEFNKLKNSSMGTLNKSLINFLPTKSVNSNGDVEIETVNSSCISIFGFNELNCTNNTFFRDDLEKTIPETGEVLLSRSNTAELVGQSCVYNRQKKIAVSDLMYRIKTSKKLNNEYLNCYFNFLFLRGDFKRMSRGTSGSMKKINENKIHQLSIPLLELNDQIKISKRINKRILSIKNLSELLNKIYLSTIDIRQSNLNKYFGKFFN